ncbi:MAG: HAD superfamily hydrolase (TIGR01509 family) [Candidatus Latescibacterota bacterium]|jgi:HAD superfamily hydrolase (TIGR01509 family)
MLKAILWDNDGVLVDTEHLYFRACREAVARIDIELSEARFIDLFLKKSEGLSALMRERGLGADEMEACTRWRNARHAELLQQGVPVIEGVREVLDVLHGKVCMGIVTSSRREHFEIVHAKTDLLPYFDFVLLREDYGESKPDPEPYLEAMRRNGLVAAECLVVEDSDRGLRAALAAGVRCAVIPQGLTRGLDFSGAWRMLDSIREIPDLVDEFSRSVQEK